MNKRDGITTMLSGQNFVWPVTLSELSPPDQVRALIAFNDITGRLDTALARSKERRHAQKRNKGERVTMSALAIERHLPGPRTGRKVGESREGGAIYVVRDGCISRKSYAKKFWEPVKATSVGRGGEKV